MTVAALAGGCSRWRRGRRCSPARPSRPGCGRRSSRCGGPGARATRPRPASGGGSRRSARWRRSSPAGCSAASRWRCRSRSPDPASPPGRSPAGAAATAPRSSARFPKSPPRSPTRSPPAARCAPRCPPRPPTSTARPPTELARLGAELDLGAGTAEAVAAWRARMRSERVDAFAAALLSQRLAGGDLAGLLRRFAAGAAERDRVAEDAKSATAQARFTGLLVVAMPTGGALFAELVQPGFLAKLLGSPAVGDPARPRRRPAGDRLRRDPPALAGGRLTPVGLLFGLATLLALAAGREVLVARATRRAVRNFGPGRSFEPRSGSRLRRREGRGARSTLAGRASRSG